MTIQQYETVRNRLDGILGGKAHQRLKRKRLSQLLADLLDSFNEDNDRFVNDLYVEIVKELVSV